MQLSPANAREEVVMTDELPASREDCDFEVDFSLDEPEGYQFFHLGRPDVPSPPPPSNEEGQAPVSSGRPANKPE